MPTARDILSQPITFPRFVIPGLIPEGGKFIIAGKSKIGKSFLAMELCSSIIRGMPFLSMFPVPKPKSVFLVQAEMPAEIFIFARLRPLAALCQDGALDRFWLEQSISFRLANPVDVAKLKQRVDLFQPDVLIIDPLYSIHVGSFNEAGAVNETLQVLNWLSEECYKSYGRRPAIGMVAHFRKASMTRSGKKIAQDMDDILGSALFGAWADSIITVIPTGTIIPIDDPDLAQPKKLDFWTRWLPPLGEVAVSMHGLPPFYTVDPKSMGPNLRILAQLSRPAGLSMTANAIASRSKSNSKTTKTLLDQLVAYGVVTSIAGEYAIRP